MLLTTLIKVQFVMKFVKIIGLKRLWHLVNLKLGVKEMGAVVGGA